MGEPTFYIMMALFTGGKTKLEIMDYVFNCSQGRVSVWPGTLDGLLEWLESSGLVREAAGAHGRAYALTERGYISYEAEQQRMRACLADASQTLEYALECAARELAAV